MLHNLYKKCVQACVCSDEAEMYHLIYDNDTCEYFSVFKWGPHVQLLQLMSMCVCVYVYMGQFLQGGKNGRLMSFFF